MTAFRIARIALLGVLPLLAAQVTAKTVDNLDDPNLLMIADGRAYPVRPVEMMLAAARLAKPDATLAQMLDGLVENQVMAVQALKEFPRATLLGKSSVGYDASIILEDQYTTLLRTHFNKELNAFVKTRPNGKLDSLIVKRIDDNDPSLKELMTLRDLGEVRLTAKQLPLAKQTVIATVRMPDGQTSNITYSDIYLRQNVQGRVRLVQDRDVKYLDDQIKNRVESLFVNWWSATKSGLNSDELALLKKILEEKYLKDPYMKKSGVTTTMHEDTADILLKLQKQVTQAEVNAWYEKNRDEFRQVERVRARHVACKSEDACNAARLAYEKGMDFSEVAKKFSIADTAKATPAGTLGWIERKDNKLGWIGEVAMIGQKGQLTGPIREPADDRGNAKWQLVLVDERVDGYARPDSDAVRAQARTEIAQKKAIERYTSLRDKLLAAANVRRNAKLIAARHAASPPGAARQPVKAADPHAHDHDHDH